MNLDSFCFCCETQSWLIGNKEQRWPFLPRGITCMCR